jgi:N-methylhydantoinase A
MLGDGSLAGGIRLDADQARNAMAPLAERLGFEVEDVARGIMTIASASMANAIREITVEQGQDPRRATLAPFGGAGPLFGTLLARELEVREIVIPPYAGNFSAWGLLGADLMQSAARTRIMKLADGVVDEANDILAELFDTVTARAVSAGGHSGTVRDAAVDMRYVGQEHTITIPLRSVEGRVVADVGEIRSGFTAEYERTFGHEMEEEVEIVSLRATLRTPLPRRTAEPVAPTTDNTARPGSVSAFSFTRSEWLDFAVVDRSSLDPASALPGPAILLEDTATTYMDAEFEARVHESGSLLIADTGRSSV